MGVMKNSRPGFQLNHLGKGFLAVSRLPGYLENKRVMGNSSLSLFSGSTGSDKVQHCPEKAQRGPHTAVLQPFPRGGPLRLELRVCARKHTAPHLFPLTAVSGTRRFIGPPVPAVGPVSSLTTPRGGFTPKASDPCRGCICSSEKRSSGKGL